MLRVAMSSFFDMAIVVADTLAEFGQGDLAESPAASGEKRASLESLPAAKRAKQGSK